MVHSKNWFYPIAIVSRLSFVRSAWISPNRSSFSHCSFSKLSSATNMVHQNWIACPTCHGEGKIKKGPSRKLRHKRAKMSADGTDSPVPMRQDPCRSCKQTGLVVPSESSTQPRTDFPHVAIIGGGLGGLALAIACRHRQIPFRIFERDDHFDQRSQGYGLTLQQASRAVAAFGIPALSEGCTSTKHVVHTIDGKVVGEWGLRKWGRDETKQPPKRQNVHIARQSLRRELLEALGEENNISWGHKLTNIQVPEKEGDKCLLEFEVAGEQETVQYSEADLVVGADGIRSTVRPHIVDDRSMPLRYLRCLVVLGICPLDVLEGGASTRGLLDGETVFQTADGTTRIYVMPFSKTECMWQLSFPMEDEAQAKELSQTGPTALRQEALRRCNEWHSPIPDILRKTPIHLVSGYPVYDRDLITMEALSSTGPIALVGDAAHPMSPFKGQGANQALLDALCLARSLYSTCCLQNNSISEALQCYHREMTERTAVKVKGSAQAAKFLHTKAAIVEGNITRGAAAAGLEQGL